MNNAKRSEIWIVNLDPTIGSEIKKSRPAVVISSDDIGKLPLKLISPITSWKEYFEDNIWHIKILPDNINGLTSVSAVDVLQTRCIDSARLIRKLGELKPAEMKEIVLGLNSIIE